MVKQKNGETSKSPDGGSRSSSSSGSSKSSSSKPGQSNRMCAQCQNHGLKEPVKGHKRFCKFRLCNCKNCLLVKERQRIVALHLYVRRAQEQEENAAEAAQAAREKVHAAHLEAFAAPELPTPPLLLPNFHHLHQHPSTSMATAAAFDAAYMRAEAQKQRNNLLMSSLLELRSRFPVPDDALPLLLCILNQSNSVNEAADLIQQSIDEFSAREPTSKSAEVSTTAFSLHQPYCL